MYATTERDEFQYRLRKLVEERFPKVQVSMILALMDDLHGRDWFPSFEETAMFLGHSFSDSFEIIDTNKNGLFLRLSLMDSSDADLMAEVIFLLISIGKVKTLDWLTKKLPEIFKETNMEKVFFELCHGFGKWVYWERRLVFWKIGKMLP